MIDEQNTTATADFEKVSWDGDSLQNGLTVYKTARGNESGNGLVVAEHEGELYVLAERTKRNPTEWEFPAGFREYLPEKPYDAEEQSASGNMLEPTRQNLKKIFAEKHAELGAEGKTAREIRAFFDDEQQVEDFLASKGVNWDRNIDATAEGAFIREVLEETGVAVDSAKVELVDSFTTVNAGSNGNRNNLTNHFFLADLGAHDVNQPVAPQNEEIEEVRWVKLKDIRRAENGTYSLEGDERPLNQGQGEMMELALQRYVDNRTNAIAGVDFKEVKDEPSLAGLGGAERMKQYFRQAEAYKAFKDGQVPQQPPAEDTSMLPGVESPSLLTRIANLPGINYLVK